jgi:hypothetical protein
VTLTIKMSILPENTLKSIRRLLEPHGVTIEVHEQPLEGDRFPCCLLLLPEGSKKERDGLTGVYHDHNKITLPNGFVFFQEVDAESWSRISFSFPIPEEKKNE